MKFATSQIWENQKGFRGYKVGLLARNGLTLFTPMSHFYTPWKRLTFSEYRNGTLAWKGSTVHFFKRNYKNLQQFQQLKTPNKFRTLVSLFVSNVNPLIANSIKWSNNSQTIRRQFADEFLECLLPFCGVGASRGKFCVSTNFTPHFTLLCSICKRL